VNTYQVALITDGKDSYAEFLYPENGLQWIQVSFQLISIQNKYKDIECSLAASSGLTVQLGRDSSTSRDSPIN